MAIIQSFFKGICFYQGFLEVLWLTLLSMLSYIVTWGSFVSTLWMLWLCYMILGILQLTVAKITSSLNKMWCCKGLPGVLWRTFFSIFSTIAVLTLFTKTFESLGVCTEELWPCGWPLPVIWRTLLCNTFLNSSTMIFLLGCMNITINGTITTGMALMRSSIEWM